MKEALSLVCRLLFALLVPQLVMAQLSEGQEGHLVIRGGWLFDSVGDERRRNSGIVIRDGRIVALGADVEQPVPSAANIIDLADTDTVLAGMIDLQAHYNLDLVDKGRADEAKYFTLYAQALLEKRGEPEPESEAEEFAQRELEIRPLREDWRSPRFTALR